MKQQYRFVALLALCMIPMGVMGQVTYNGNGNGGFGGPLGGGSLQISNDGTNISFVFTRGGGNFNDGLVIYFDSESGGHTSTSSFTDTGDYLRRAVSGRDGTTNAVINFPNGFEADFGLGVHVNTFDFAGLFNLNAIAAHGYVGSGNLVGTPAPSGATFSFSIQKSELGISGDVQFRFVATYLNANGPFRSNEAIGAGFGGSNPGTGSVTMTSYWEYPVKNEITNTKSTSIANSAGWRMMASPVSTTYATLLGPVWTQGATGSDSPSNGTASVRTYAAAGGYTNVTDLSASLTAGQGFIFYHFNDDNYDGTPNASATTLTVTGAENASGTTYTPAWTSGTQYAIAGNPFATAIDWDLVGKAAGVSATAWVWNPATSAYFAWNGTDGSLTDGLIAPFQGFWIEYTSASSTVTFETADKATSATFRGKEAQPWVIALGASQGDLASTGYVQFSADGSLGKDRMDAVSFTPLATSFVHVGTLAEGVSYDINHLPMIAEMTEIPLSVRATAGGIVALNVAKMNLPTGWNAYLRDNESGAMTPMNEDWATEITLPRAKMETVNPIDFLGQPVLLAAESTPRFTLIVDPGTSTSTPDAGRQTPDAIALHGAYPNPFNPSTAIRFTLDAGRQTRLAVYDMLGRQVAVLVDGQMPAGEHRVTFDASGLTSGVYIVRLEAGGMSMTRRITLLK